MPYGMGVLDVLLMIANSMPTQYSGMQKDDDGYNWIHHPYFQVPKESRTYMNVDNPNSLCQDAFGGGSFSGCTIFAPDENGPMATVVLPKRTFQNGRQYQDLYDHETRHTEGWVHPDKSILEALSKPNG